MDVNKLLDRLTKVKATGPNKWMACCPAHDDRSPSLSVRLVEDGRLLVHCFGGGCGAADVISAVGLDFADLFPPRPDTENYSRPAISHPFTAADALRCLASESGVIAIAIADMVEGRQIKECDSQRISLAQTRIATAMGYVYGNR